MVPEVGVEPTRYYASHFKCDVATVTPLGLNDGSDEVFEDLSQGYEPCEFAITPLSHHIFCGNTIYRIAESSERGT